MTRTAFTEEIGSIVLPPPQTDAGASLMQALKLRRSTRDYSPRPLPLPLLSTLLWAAFGINRPDKGGRTAPSAHDWQEIDIYAVLPEGAYRYDPAGHTLRLTVGGDHRSLTGVQEFVAQAPLNLVYVARFSHMVDADAEQRTFFAAADAGFIAQNVYLFCASAGLACVVRGLVDRRRLAPALHLQVDERIVLAQSVGFPGNRPSK
jgi:SagB-type dehydrogenase family enzyme